VRRLDGAASERAAVGAAALVGGLLIAQQVAGRALRDALFLSAFSVSSLPGMILAAALVSVCGALIFAGALARRAPATVLTWALTLQGQLLAGEWVLAGDSPRPVAVALYVQLALLGPGLLSAFWSLVNERFDPHTARRVMGRIGTGASLGGVVGGALAWAATHVFPVHALLLGLSVTSLLAPFAVALLRSAAVREEHDAPGTADSVLTRLRSIRQFPYLRQLALLVSLGAVGDVLLDYILKVGAARALTDGAELARFFSLFYACAALITLAVQATATRASLERMGLAGTVSLQPAVVALASAAGLAYPSLAGAMVARGLGSALRDSLFRSGYELFYTPLPARLKRGSKALVDIVADKLGALTGAGVVMLLAAQPLLSDRWLWLLALLATLASMLLVRRLHRGYVGALESSLRSGLVALESDEVFDSTTRLTLTRTALDRESLLAEIRALHGAAQPAADSSSDEPLRVVEALRSGDPLRIRGAILKMGPPDPALAHLLVGLLARDDVFPNVLRALRGVAPRITGQLVDALLDPHQPPRVRRRIPRVLKAAPTARAIDGVVLGLADADFAVRRACSTVLAWMREHHPELSIPRGTVYEAVASELDAPAADADAQLDHVFSLLSAVGEGEALKVTRWALRGQDTRLRGTALEYLEQVLPDGVRQALMRRLGAGRPAPERARALDEVEDELLRSSTSLPRGPLSRGRRS
jgi:ATP:ADP antiporter, AAA family